MFQPSAARRGLRAATAGAATVALLLSLAACGDDKSDKSSESKKTDDVKSSDCIDIPSGETSDAIKVTGDFGKEQKATFDTPLKGTDAERTIVSKGNGDLTAKGDQVDVLISVFLGSDGKSVGTQPATLKVGDPQILETFSATVDCVPIGSRVVATAPAKDLYGPEGNSQLGIEADDTVVIVTDVIGLKEMPKPKAWSDGVPKVEFDGDGKPTVTLPKTDPPAELLLKVLKEGDGAEVKAGDQVTLDYQGTSWNDGKIFDQSYGKQPATFGTDQVVTGFGAALIGQKVGTRLVVSIPPKYAYGEEGSGNDLAGQTLLFVIEIKDTKSS